MTNASFAMVKGLQDVPISDKTIFASNKSKANVTFVLCKSCLWCASEVASSNDTCPSCGGAVYRIKLNLRNVSIESIKSR